MGKGGYNLESAIEIQNYINKYLKKSKKNNLKSLSKSSGITYPTLRRLANGEGSPSYRTAICILMVITNNDSQAVCNYLDQYFPNEAKLFKTILQKTEFAEDELQDTLEDEFDYFVLAYIGTKVSTKNSIARILGNPGLKSLDKFINQNLVFEENGKLRLKTDNYMLTNNNILNTIKSHALFFNQDMIGSEGACLYNLTEGVSIEGIRKIKAELNLFLTKACEIMDNYNGNIPIFLNGMMNAYDENLIKEDTNNE